MAPFNGQLQAPIFTESGIANGAITPGCGVVAATPVDGATSSFDQAGATATFVFGVAGGVAPMTAVADQQAFAKNDKVQIYKPGSEALILLSGAVTDITIPLVNNATGFTPATTGTMKYSAIARETGASGTYIRAYVTYGQITI